MSEETEAAPSHGAVRADTAGMMAFAHEAAALAERLQDAATHTRRADPAALGPILGPVGAAFLAASSAAHLAHVHGLDVAADRLAAAGSGAAAAAAAYRRNTDETSARLRAAAEDL